MRAEKVERSFPLVLDIGGPRHAWLRGTGKVEKCYLIQVAAHKPGPGDPSSVRRRSPAPDDSRARFIYRES